MIIISALALSLASSHLAASDEIDRAKASASKISEVAGSADAINANYVNPMLSPQQLHTTDGSSTFGAQLGCSSSNKFLDIAVQPLPTGDVRFLHVLQDVSNSGSLSNVTPTQYASGICANGIIQCTQGQWSNCASFTWGTNQQGALTLEPASLSDMGGCYCVNNSCGNNITWNNLSNILNDLGGGASSALARINPHHAASDSAISNTSIEFYGQTPGSCIAQEPGSVTPTPAETYKLSAYLSNPSQMKVDAFSASTSDNIYQSLVTSNLGSTDNFTYNTCSIRRNIDIDDSGINDIIGFDGGAGRLTVCGADCLELVIGQIGDNYWHGWCKNFTSDTLFSIKKPERIINATLVNAKFDDWIQVRVNGDVIWSGPYNNWTGDGAAPGACELNTEWSQNPNVGFTSYLKKKGQVRFHTKVQVGGSGEGFTRAIIKVDTSCKLKPDYIEDSCRVLQEDPDCKLYEETVDGVTTYSTFASTGVTPLPQTNDIVGAQCTVPATRDWFVKERKYQCRGKNDYDFSQGLERAAYVYDNATSSSFEDRVVDAESGQYKHSSGSLTTPNPIDILDYAPMCKTRIPRAAFDVALSGVIEDNTVSKTKYDIFYKECQDNTCPISQPGEEIIKNCQNINEFAEAATIMQTLRQAGKDIICTSGTAQKL